jgi:thiamine-phosphate diphosphorylase
MAAHAAARVTRSQRSELLRGIYAILNENPRVVEIGRAVLAAGVRLLQYRAKRGIVAEHILALRGLTQQHDALLIVNDDWRVADAFSCDGVHLGPDDAGFDNVITVRKAMPQRLIGISCGTISEVCDANTGAVDYLGAGSVYATASKDNAGPPIGTDGLRSLVEISVVPVAAIGGITAATLADVYQCGAQMAAVISAISSAAQPERAARELVEIWSRCSNCGAAP